MGGHEMSVQDVKKHVRGYLIVFFALLCLTVVTVGLSYLHLPVGLAIAAALVVASVKASLVALFFMHLISEKQIIYAILALTAVLFIFLMAVNLMI